MTDWLPEGTACWGGRPVARSAAEVEPRRRAVLSGTIRSVTVRHGSGPSLEAVLADGTGTITLAWTGRKAVPGIAPGAAVTVEGTVFDRRGWPVLLNPLYRFSDPSSSTSW